MAVSDEFIEQVSEALDQLGYSVEQEEDVISDVSQINDDVTLPGIRVQSGTMTGYVSMKLAVLKAYLDNTLRTIQQTWDAWFSDTLPTGVRKVWTTWFGICQDEWNTMSTQVGDATELATQAAGNADAAARNANQKAGVAEDKAALADEKAGYAKGEGDRAKAYNDHPWEIRDDGFIYVWDETTQAMVKTNKVIIDFSDLTPEQQAAIVQEFLSHIVYASVAESEAAANELT